MTAGTDYKKGRLARRLIVAILLFSTAITVITTAVQLYADYDQDVAAIHSRIDQIKESQLNSIVASVWFLDNKQVQLQLDGLRRMPDIEFLSIEVEGEVKWSSGKIVSSESITQDFPLIHESLGREDEIGTLKVAASLDEVFRQLYNKFVVILISNGFKTFLVAGFIYFIVWHLITRHLDRFALYAERFELGEDAPSLNLDRPASKTGAADEFDKLANALNAMQLKLSKSYGALKDSEGYNRTLFEQSPVGQALCKMDRTFVDVNAAYANIIGRPINDLLGIRTSDITPDHYNLYDLEQLTLLQKKGSFGPYEKEYIREDGSMVPIRIFGHLLDKGRETFIWIVVEDITQVRKAQDDLLLSEERFKDFAESSSDWLWELDENLKFSSFSDRYEEITGIDPLKVLGKKRSELDWVEADKEEWDAHLKDLEERRPFKELTIRLTRTDGTFLHSRLNGKPFFDADGKFKGYRGTGTNVTDIVKAEEELQLSEKRFKDFAEASSDWFWEIDETYTFTYVSPSFEIRTGIPNSSCMGEKRHQNKALVPMDGDWSEHLKLLDAREPFVDFPFKGTREDGSTLYALSSGIPIFGDDGTFIGYRGSGRDVTEMVMADAKREQLEAQLRQSQRLETVGTLAGGIAHDFNNLLMPILGYTEIMLKQLSPEDSMFSKLERIARAAERAKTLVQQVLTFSRRGEQSRKPTNLSEIIEETLKLIRAAIPTSIKIRTNVEDNCPTVLADSTQMHQLVMNLCTNATQAMGSEGGTLTLAMSSTEAELLTSPGVVHPHIKITVSDDGPGMEKAVLERIFEPFFSTKKQQGGTGLGLATVHGIVSSHNGTIEAFSNPGEGASFEVLLPVFEGDDKKEAEIKENSSGGNEHILFVDDEPENGDLAKAMLTDLGYTVDVFTDSLKALEYYGENMDEIDLLITDQTMPNLTGEGLVRNIKSLKKDTPIIMITGFSEHMDEEKSQELGIDKLLMKPVKMERMAEAIREALSNGYKA
ncbi:MAG: PAS domain S-box protein [Rhodospirillales bacterium]|nr:PAS domain S-box protein [Rhodospirillales bacterium]